MAPCAAFLVGAAFPGACGGEQDARPRPTTNVLLISLDSTRRDLLGVYGRVPKHAPSVSPSPNLDRLAAEGALALDAVSTTSWTLPSHLSILTGEPELVHAVDLDYHRPDARFPTLAERLDAFGYRTAGFFSGPYLEPHFGFARGFDRYEACYGDPLGRASERAARAVDALRAAKESGNPSSLLRAQWESNLAQQELDKLSHRDMSSTNVTRSALEELERASSSGEPFFLFAHYFDPHYDYVPPAPFDTSFDAEYSGELDGRDFYVNPALAVPDAGSPSGRRRVVSERDLEHVQALYEGELAWTDSQVGALLAKLDELALAANTLVIVLADHGDEFFEHGSIGHRRTLYDEVVRVPLILRLPGTIPAGVRIEESVSTLDVLPTILEALGIPPPEELYSRGLLPLLGPGGDEADGGDGEHRKRGERRGIPGRIVLLQPRSVRVAGASGPLDVPCVQYVARESWRQNGIKVLREFSWVRTASEQTVAVQRTVAEQSRSRLEKDELRWIDLALHPREEAAAFSSNFADPRARAALQAFHDEYARLSRVRGRATLGTNDESSGALKGLGYTEGASALGMRGSDEFVLPPPGEGILVPR